MWCEQMSAHPIKNTVYWGLPDGTRAVEIDETPGIKCSACRMEYQKETVIKEIEDQLFLIDTSKINCQIDYNDRLDQPRLLKRNYFDIDY
jgi:uncharacterized YokU family protein